MTPEQREKFLVLLERVEGFSFGHPDYQDAVYALEAWIEQVIAAEREAFYAESKRADKYEDAAEYNAKLVEGQREREAALLENLEENSAPSSTSGAGRKRDRMPCETWCELRVPHLGKCKKQCKAVRPYVAWDGSKGRCQKEAGHDGEHFWVYMCTL